jgi:hypothetical protein
MSSNSQFQTGDLMLEGCTSWSSRCHVSLSISVAMSVKT